MTIDIRFPYKREYIIDSTFGMMCVLYIPNPHIYIDPYSTV